MKKIEVLLSERALQTYRELQKEDKKIQQSICRAIQQKLLFLKENYNYGNPIAKRLIPKEYKKECKATNIHRIELPSFWRLLYTIRSNDTKEIISILILDILNHKRYNKKFCYANN
jgi:hypothetical protein